MKVRALGDGEPSALVDFGDLDALAGTWGPLQFAGVADEIVGVAVALKGPSGDDFAAFLLNGAEFAELAPCGEAGFFFELADGGFDRLFAGIGLAFGEGPSASVFLRPEWAAGMDEEDLESDLGVAIHEKAGALFGHRCLLWMVRQFGC